MPVPSPRYCGTRPRPRGRTCEARTAAGRCSGAGPATIAAQRSVQTLSAGHRPAHLQVAGAVQGRHSPSVASEVRAAASAMAASPPRGPRSPHWGVAPAPRAPAGKYSQGENTARGSGASTRAALRQGQAELPDLGEKSAPTGPGPARRPSSSEPLQTCRCSAGRCSGGPARPGSRGYGNYSPRGNYCHEESSRTVRKVWPRALAASARRTPDLPGLAGSLLVRLTPRLPALRTSWQWERSGSGAIGA